MPIPPADEADIAEQARPVDAGIDECDVGPDELGENQMPMPVMCSTSSERSPVTMTITRGGCRPCRGGVSLAGLGTAVSHYTTVVHRRHGIAQRAIPAGLVKSMTVAGSVAAIPQAVRPGGLRSWRQLAPVQRSWVRHDQWH